MFHWNIANCDYSSIRQIYLMITQTFTSRLFVLTDNGINKRPTAVYNKENLTKCHVLNRSGHFSESKTRLTNMADSTNTQEQGDKSTFTSSDNRAMAMLNRIINLPVGDPSTVEPASQTNNQKPDAKYQDLSSPPQPHLRLDPSSSSSQGTRTSEAEDQSISHQLESRPPMSFTSRPREQANPQTHLRGGCDDESCDCCCCAYPRFGPHPQPMYHRLWYGKPGTG